MKHYLGWTAVEGKPRSDRLPGAKMARLVTVVDVDDRDNSGPDAPSMHLSARHEAELDDGQRVVLLGDRGWTQSGSANVWNRATTEDIAATARAVVGPDEPDERLGETYEAMEAYHYGMLDGMLQQHRIDAGDIRSIPHDVELSERVLSRLGHGHP